jgi:nucleoside-diphosphate-sugar epimerase
MSDVVRVVASTTDLPTAIEEDRPDLIINMANLYTRQSDLETVARLVEVNSLLMSIVAEACIRTGARLLHIGSAWQTDLSAGSLGLDEAPIYSLHRGIASSVGRWYRMHRGLDFTELAIADTYGPNDPRGKLITQMLDSAQRGATDFALGSQDPTLYPVHVDDVARCVAEAVDSPRPGSQGPWLCAWQPGISVAQIVTIINDLYGVKMVPKFGSRPPRPELDLNRFSRLPNWEPSISPREGLLLLGAR